MAASLTQISLCNVSQDNARNCYRLCLQRAAIRASESSSVAIAKRLVESVTNWYMCGAETQLLTAYFLGFSRGNIAWLRTEDAPGYEIEEFSLRVSADVLQELERLNPPPTQQEAALWLDVTKNAVHPSDWERWTTGDHPEEFLLTLRSIAESVD